MSTEKIKKEEKKENILVNLAFNIVIPALILSKLTHPNDLGPIWGLIVALLFPLGYGIYDFAVRKKQNFISIIGFISIFFTGIIGVFNFPAQWIAVKEAAVPLLIGLAILISVKTPFPLVKKIIYNPEILDIERIETILTERNNLSAMDKLMNKASVFLAGSFFISSALNFILAKIIIHSETGTEAFAQELGKMAWLSYPVIALPSTVILLLIFWYLFSQLKKLTSLTTNELMSEKLREK